MSSSSVVASCPWTFSSQVSQASRSEFGTLGCKGGSFGCKGASFGLVEVVTPLDDEEHFLIDVELVGGIGVLGNLRKALLARRAGGSNRIDG